MRNQSVRRAEPHRMTHAQGARFPQPAKPRSIPRPRPLPKPGTRR
ncbi:hypothetical protein SAMN05421806_12640 [Streptomyces indicus]|uniref:Uncharacterized protein n=1 Tax=Streptomyces indicus TaxID=417292 RepID=A0A1G9J087_9ACTN|nr:hypothetical protein SAMN05421806_12640 [Streptomyces indicus]